MNENSIPVTLTVGDDVVFAGNIYVAKLLAVLGQKAVVGSSFHRSFPITAGQAATLLRKVDPKSATFLKALAQNDGELDFGSMQKIFGIQRWQEYSGSYGKGITRALRHMTDNSSASLVFWDDEEWDGEEDANGPVYIDGEALSSLKAAAI